MKRRPFGADFLQQTLSWSINVHFLINFTEIICFKFLGFPIWIKSFSAFSLYMSFMKEPWNVIRRGCRDHDSMVVGFITTYAISAHHPPLMLLVRIPLRRGVLDTTLCDKVCQWLVTGRLFSPGTLVSSANNTDCYNILKYCWKWH